jgi:hypothetical protein
MLATTQNGAAREGGDADQTQATRQIGILEAEIAGLRSEVTALKEEQAVLERDLGIRTSTNPLLTHTEKLRFALREAGSVVKQKATEIRSKLGRAASTEPTTAIDPEVQTSSVDESANAEDSGEPCDQSLNFARAKMRLATLNEELTAIEDTISAKASEIAWLQKKHGIRQEGSFSARLDTLGSKIKVVGAKAKEDTKVGMRRASQNAKNLWMKAGTQMSEMMRRARSSKDKP